MRVVRIDVTGQGDLDGAAALLAAAAALPPGAPVAVMIHGYRYSPGQGRACPHRTLYAPEPLGHGQLGWPAVWRLDAAGGLSVGLGWRARGMLHAAYLRAGAAGAALARLLPALRDAAPGARITLVGHSLGARVALAALRRARPGDVDAAILLAPAEFGALAQAAADSPAGRAARILCVTSRENAVFDRGLGLLLSAGLLPTLGRGLPAPRPHWTDLHLHDHDSLAALAALGHPVAPPARAVCHWSAYTRPGVLSLYRALIVGALAPERLAAALATRAPARSPSARLRLPLPLPAPRNASS